MTRLFGSSLFPLLLVIGASDVGAQGFGQPILTGIRLADNGLIMEGAVPAAILAVSAQGFFGLTERWLVPRGLRLESGA